MHGSEEAHWLDGYTTRGQQTCTVKTPERIVLTTEKANRTPQVTSMNHMVSTLSEVRRQTGEDLYMFQGME